MATKKKSAITTSLPDGEYTTVEGVDVKVQDSQLEVTANDLNIPETAPVQEVSIPYPAPQLSEEEIKMLNEQLWYRNQPRLSKYRKAKHPHTSGIAVAKRRAKNKAAAQSRKRNR